MSYQVLLGKIKKISKANQKYIEEIKLSKDLSLFLLKNNYPHLPVQISTHSKVTLSDERMTKIASLMKSDKNVKNFISVDIQYFLTLLVSNQMVFISKFKKEFERIGIIQMKDKREFLERVKSVCLEDYPEGRKIHLQLFKFMGFITPFHNPKDTDLEDPEYFFSRCLEKYYFESIWTFNEQPSNFKDHILKPFLDVMEILGKKNSVQTDMKNIIYLDSPEINEKEIQDFLCCLQYHIFFEEYVNFLIDNKKDRIIKNPLILFNPLEERDRDGNLVIGGYFELDGSLFIKRK